MRAARLIIARRILRSPAYSCIKTNCNETYENPRLPVSLPVFAHACERLCPTNSPRIRSPKGCGSACPDEVRPGFPRRHTQRTHRRHSKSFRAAIERHRPGRVRRYETAEPQDEERGRPGIIPGPFHAKSKRKILFHIKGQALG